MEYSLAPLLSVRGGAEAVEFYKAAFGATELYRVENHKGEVVSQLDVEGAPFWVAEEAPDHANFSPESLDGGTVRMLLEVDDPDAAIDKAAAAGATIVYLAAEQHGWRLGRIVDPYGHHWEIGRPPAPVS